MNKTDLRNNFSSFSINVDESLLEQCAELCLKYNVDAEDLVDTWIAFSFSHLSGAAPTAKTLSEFERKELAIQKTPKRNIGSTHGFKSDWSSPKSFNSETPRKGNLKSDASAHRNIRTPTTDVYSPSTKYGSRTNKNQITCTFGGNTRSNWVSSNRELTPKEYSPTNFDSWKCMYDSISDMQSYIRGYFEDIAEYLIEKHGLPEPVELSTKSTESLTYVGRVLPFDKGNRTSVQIEDLTGLTASLDLSQIGDFSVFPGQVVAVQGVSGSNGVIIVEKFVASAALPLPDSPKLNGHLEILVAAGPFTLSDTLSFEPLIDLIEYVKVHQPNLLLLIGPILECNHCKILDCSLNETVFELYERMVQTLSDSLAGCATEICIIASGKDANNIPIFPTRPSVQKKSFPRVSFFPDPSVLVIDGLVIGLTATDSVLHLGKYEISSSMANRLPRLASHIIEQQTFYPLYPPENDVGLDPSLWNKYSRLPITPHILVVPSDLHCFAKDVGGCLVMNPEKLVKGMTGGSFACIEVQPELDNEVWKCETHVSCKMVKV